MAEVYGKVGSREKRVDVAFDTDHKGDVHSEDDRREDCHSCGNTKCSDIDWAGAKEEKYKVDGRQYSTNEV